MSRNTLKLIACLSMLIDHIGYILLPEAPLLRYIGRLAMPIFAFFIGEGCLYTRDRKKYFLRLFLLGVLCQLFYVGEYLFSEAGNPFYLNILLTFSASVLLASAFLAFTEKREKEKKTREGFTFLLLLLLFTLICLLGEKKLIPLEFDYGLSGMLLPLFATVSKDIKKKLPVFAAGLLIFVFSKSYTDPMWTVCALLSFIPLCFYNGKAGERKLQKAFYLFYPLHLGVLYLISLFI